MRAIWRREINIRAFGFSHDRPEQFVRSQWQKSPKVSTLYIIYRWAFALFFLSVWIWSFFNAAKQNTEEESFVSKWPIYLTNWGYTLCTTQALLAAGLVTQRLIKERTTASLVHKLCSVGYLKPISKKREVGISFFDVPMCTQDESPDTSDTTVGFVEDHAHMPLIYKVYWVLHTVAAVIAIGITGSYFVVDYNPALHTLTPLNLLMHGFNSVLMVFDVLVVDHPFRLLHFCWPFLFIFVYFSFTVVYYFAGGTGKNNAPSIYPALDWRYVKKTLPIATLGMMSVLLAHFCTWLAVIVRKKVGGSEADSCQEIKISKPITNKVRPLDINLS